MSESERSGEDLLEGLYRAIGGLDRIRSVRSYAREAVRVRGAASGEATLETLLTWRAAGGKIRIEFYPYDGYDRSTPSSLLVWSGGEVTADDERIPRTAASLGDPPGARAIPDAALRALEEASREPRNLLAHLEESEHRVRISEDGVIEIRGRAREVRGAAREFLGRGHEIRSRARKVPGGAQEARGGVRDPEFDHVYRFDPRSGLCISRSEPDRGTAGRSASSTSDRGTVIRYLDWRPVAGIATPFLEVREGSGEIVEERVVAVAYDLPLPDRLFRPRDP